MPILKENLQRITVGVVHITIRLYSRHNISDSKA